MRPFPSQWQCFLRITVIILSNYCVFLLLPVVSPAQQCTLPSRIFLPTANEAVNEGLGHAVDVHEEYMVAGIPYNSSLQVYNGLVFIYKLSPENQWIKIAELHPSDIGKYRHFGKHVA